MTDVEDGRYLYCAVRVDDADPTLDATGVEGEPVRVVDADGIGAVVHDCESLYDATDPQTVQRWLLDHQAVVDDAAERFGTPLPFRFDTVLRGGDEGVRSFLEERREDLSERLAEFAGRREYRVEVLVDEETLDEQLAAEDERLRELAERTDEASEGTAFMLEKQYDERLAELRRERSDERSRKLEDRLVDLADDLERLGSRPSALTGGTDGEKETTQARIAVLAPTEGETAIGEVLDDVAAEAGVTVRFTGPWPPYTFSPTFDDGTE
ncbi:gas vesicle protein GvpFL [Halobacteriales archaeon QS_5_70_15]|nr:MAG: gas vesicle protein GvpFL [Halobacteriales archaeon QS_5_70_15]